MTEHADMLSSRRVRNHLIDVLQIFRVTATALETLGLAPLGAGEQLCKQMLREGLLRPIPETDAGTTELASFGTPYDVVRADGTVVKQHRKASGPKKPKKDDGPNPAVPPLAPAWILRVQHAWKLEYTTRDWVYVATKGRLFYALALANTQQELLPRYIRDTHIRLAIKRLLKDRNTEQDHVCKARNCGTAYRWLSPPSATAETVLQHLLRDTADE